MGNIIYNGWSEAIIGPMFSGKTTELIRRVYRVLNTSEEVQVFKPNIENRYGQGRLFTHDGALKSDAENVDDIRELPEMIKPDTTVLALDEVHMFGEGFFDTVQALAESHRVIFCGLLFDFYGEVFLEVAKTVAAAELVFKPRSICMEPTCKRLAVYSELDPEYMPQDGDRIVQGGKEMYSAKCRNHFKPICKPK